MGTISTADVLAEFRTAVAAIRTSRDAAATFLPHEGNEDFDEAPSSRLESFTVEKGRVETLGSWGRANVTQRQVQVFIRLSVADAGVDYEREEWAAADVERVSDILEHRTWSEGIDAVFFMGEGGPDRSNAVWWRSTLEFRVVFCGEVES